MSGLSHDIAAMVANHAAGDEDGFYAVALDVAHRELSEGRRNAATEIRKAIEEVRAEALAGTPNMENPYERLKDLTRGQRVDAARMREFVGELGLSEAAAQRLKDLTPGTYTGLAADLAREHLGK